MTEISVKMGSNTSITVSAPWKSGPLAVHRQVVWVPAKEEWKTTSKWQITHVESGLALLRPSRCTGRMKQAVALARKILDEVGESNLEGERVSSKDAHLISSLINDWYDNIVEELEETEEKETRYVTRRGDTGYDVVDLHTGKVVDASFHRGLAAARATELNLGVE
jgi:hypothetical protein